ncbi:FRG domain-containing protein [Chloroflexota bacterium]
MDPFYLKKCKDLDDFISKVKKYINTGWIFRGQRICSRGLKHSFERVCERFTVDGKDRLRVESNMVREFQRRLHHYTQNIPDMNSYDEWMALMQHHGAPTRLMDFTYSPHVAAYFAFESAKSDTEVAIWAVNAEWCKKHLEEFPKHLHRRYRTYLNTRETEAFKEIFLQEKAEKFILTVNPFRLNERLAYQRGVFLCPSNVEHTFMDNMCAYTEMKELKNKVIKFTIPTGKNNNITKKALEYLDILNISRITLFPGLDGFAQSFGPKIDSLFLRQHFPLFSQC